MPDPDAGVAGANTPESFGEHGIATGYPPTGAKVASSSLEVGPSRLERQESNGRREALRLAEWEKL
jgi:hypothetical protein